MSPRSLLFSSDQETSRILSQVLLELALKHESCPEIFAALRSLTSRAFELIVVDWDEGPEASFLLKTARELKSTQAAFVVVIGRIDASAALQQAGADLVLSKPVTADQTRHALLTSKEFVSRMKPWLPQCQVRQTVAPVEGKELWSTPLPQPQSATLVAPASAAIGRPRDLPTNLTFATFDDGFLRKYSARPNKTAGRLPALLRIAAMTVAFFALGYVFSQPLTKAARSTVEMSRATWEKTQDWWYKSPVEVQAASEPAAVADPAPIADAETSPWPDEKTSTSTATRIRITPVRDTLAARQEPAPTAMSPASLQNDAPALPNQSSAVQASVRIPESLESPFPGVATVRNVASKITPALLDALEPITVPEQLSEKLLLDKVEPNYPQRALQAGLQGPVVLQAFIGTDGRIRDLKLIRGSLLLGQAACDAVKQWRYKPYLLNGQAVEAQTTVTLDFKRP